jgi:hypothetical protein
MAELRIDKVAEALAMGLRAQGHPAGEAAEGIPHIYPVHGTIDLIALAEGLQSALRDATPGDDEAKTPAELNATNDG